MMSTKTPSKKTVTKANPLSVDLTYKLVREEQWGCHGRSCRGHGNLRIVSSTSDKTATGNGPIPCMAAFQWAEFSAGFACSSTQADGTFSDFKINKDSRESGMEEVENVVVELLDDVTDENGKKLLFVDMDSELNIHVSLVVGGPSLSGGDLYEIALAAVRTTLAAIRTAFASFFSDKTTAKGCETVGKIDVSVSSIIRWKSVIIVAARRCRTSPIGQQVMKRDGG
ncbi:MAG: hypothetical protein ASARMPREDX12_006309 [Alectoria sarmentosa]|nr:MAG: hypothetical protein ASARMPREDX12_006309 [Alectoria sarmentosa]